MKIRTQDGTLVITLPCECTIAKTEADTEKIRAGISEDLERVELLSEAVKEMDTAYFQMLLSLKATAGQKGMIFSASGTSPEIRRVCELYGLSLDSEITPKRSDIPNTQTPKRKQPCQKPS